MLKDVMQHFVLRVFTDCTETWCGFYHTLLLHTAVLEMNVIAFVTMERFLGL